MAFTDRFIKVPIRVYDKKHKELTGEEISEDEFMKINPFEIVSYRTTVDDLQPDIPITCIKEKNGDTTLVYLHLDEFEKLLNEFGK